MINNIDQMEVLLGAMSGEKFGDTIQRQEKRGQQKLIRSQKLPCVYRGDNYIEKLTQMGVKSLEDHNEQFGKGELFFAVELPEGWSVKPSDHNMWSYLKDNKNRERASIFYKAAFYDRDAFINFNRRFSVTYQIPDYDVSLFEHKPEYIESGEFKTIWVDEEGKQIEEYKMMREEMMVYLDFDSGYGRERWDKKRRKEKAIKPVKKAIYIKNPDYIALTGFEKYSQPFHYEVHDCDDTILFSSDVVKMDFDFSEDKRIEFWEHKEEVEEKAKQQCYSWLHENYPDYMNVSAYWD